jgi:hypothetical protein
MAVALRPAAFDGEARDPLEDWIIRKDAALAVSRS